MIQLCFSVFAEASFYLNTISDPFFSFSSSKSAAHCCFPPIRPVKYWIHTCGLLKDFCRCTHADIRHSRLFEPCLKLSVTCYFEKKPHVSLEGGRRTCNQWIEEAAKQVVRGSTENRVFWKREELQTAER